MFSIGHVFELQLFIYHNHIQSSSTLLIILCGIRGWQVHKTRKQPKRGVNAVLMHEKAC